MESTGSGTRKCDPLPVFDAKFEAIDLGRGDQPAPQYRALNPNQKMPTLTDGESVLRESNARLFSMAVRRPESGFWPSDLRDQGGGLHPHWLAGIGDWLTKPAPPPLPAPPPVDPKAWTESLNMYHPAGGNETVAKIGGIINAETQGMKDRPGENESLSTARQKIAHVRNAMAAESFPAGRRSQAEGPRIGVPGKRSWFVGAGNSERRPAIGKQCLSLFPRRTGDGGSDQRAGVPTSFACGVGERGAKPRVKAALPLNDIRKYGANVQTLAGMASPEMSGPDDQASVEAARLAAIDDTLGIDPTHGATHYNMRTDTETARGGPFEQVFQPRTVSGPSASPTPYRWIWTYGKDPKREK